MNLNKPSYQLRRTMVDIKRLLATSAGEGMTLSELREFMPDRSELVVTAMANLVLLKEAFELDNKKWLLDGVTVDLHLPIWKDSLFNQTDKVCCWLEEARDSTFSASSYDEIGSALGMSSNAVRKIVSSLAPDETFRPLIAEFVSSFKGAGTKKVHSVEPAVEAEPPVVTVIEADFPVENPEPAQPVPEPAQIPDKLNYIPMPAVHNQELALWRDTLIWVDGVLAGQGVEFSGSVRTNLSSMASWIKEAV